MSVTDETVRIGRELRTAVNTAIDDETRALTRAWARAWDSIVVEIDQAAADILAATADGGTPTVGQVRRMTRAQNALDAATDSINRILAAQGRRITPVISDVVIDTARSNARQIASQLPRSVGTTSELTVRFDRVSREVLDAIVGRTTERITAASAPLSGEATEQMLRALSRAIPQGLSPRTAARQMVRAVEGRFNGGLARALTIARTEIVDAYRAGAAVQQAANADVLAGWVWSAQLDGRTCPSCVALHGSEHSLEEAGPWDHQNGRCARTPLVKPWDQLGIGLEEPPSVITPGPEWFDAQPAARQLQIMGPGRLEALQSGRASWSDMSVRRRTDGWRDSFGPAPVGVLAA